MYATLYPWMHLVGRTLFALVFIFGGVAHFTQSSAMVGYATAKGAPLPKLGVPLTGLMAIAGALCVILGWHRFIGAGLLFIFTLLTSFLMHAFWKEKDAMARMTEMSQFLKDLALGGGALFTAVYAGQHWPMSLGG